MLEETDNDLPKANDENVSEEASIPNTKKEDDTTESQRESSEKAVTGKKAEKDEPVLQKEEKKMVVTIEGILNDTTTQEDHLKQQFETMDPKEMLEHFSETLSNNPVQSLKGTIDALTKAFEKKMTALKASQRQIFINEGGNPDAFYFNPQVLKDFNNLIRRYKSDRSTYYRSVEEKQRKNLEQRLALIEELKGLLSVDQDINFTYKQFKNLQRSWKDCLLYTSDAADE